MQKLTSGLNTDGLQTVVFIVRPLPIIVERMAELVRSDPDRQFVAIFVPHVPIEIEKLIDVSLAYGGNALVLPELLEAYLVLPPVDLATLLL